MTASTPVPTLSRPVLTWDGVAVRTGAVWQFDNIAVRLAPEGYVAIRFTEQGGNLEVESWRKTHALLEQLFPDEPGYGTWEIRSTKPTFALREATRDLTPEQLRLRYVPVVVGPVGRMIMKFFRRVLGLSVELSIHETPEEAHRAVTQRILETGYVAPWL